MIILKLAIIIYSHGKELPLLPTISVSDWERVWESRGAHHLEALGTVFDEVLSLHDVQEVLPGHVGEPNTLHHLNCLRLSLLVGGREGDRGRGRAKTSFAHWSGLFTEQ